MTSQTKMDISTVCQRRKMCLKKYARCPAPFHHCNEIGLDFDLASNTQKKLDLHLLTNGVILEVCDFAETMNKSEGHFISMILEKNFDLGLENEQQRLDFAVQILHRVKDLRRKRPVFPMFDTSPEPDSNCMIESFQMETGDSREEEFQCPQATSQKCTQQTQCLSHGMDGANADDHEHELQWSGAQSWKGSFPHCEEIGLNFDIGTKQTLDPGLLTKAVIWEVVQFTRMLTASFRCIVLDVLEHNFELDLKNQQVKNQIWFKILQLLERRRLLETETFCFQPSPLKRHRDSDSSNTGALQWGEMAVNDMEEITSEHATKRHRIERHSDTISDPCSAGSSQTSNQQNCFEKEHKDELKLMLWKLRANHIRHILSIPHEEQCPLYSYSRCKKMGIDFNVGSGVKQNLDPKLLTSGLMVELNIFARQLLSAQKYFVAEILEHNCHLHFKNELCRHAFANQIHLLVGGLKTNGGTVAQMETPLEFPDISCLQELTPECHKCYQERSREPQKDGLDPDHEHRPSSITVAGKDPADKDRTAQNDPSFSFSTIKTSLLESYRGCAKIGLNLFVDEDRPKEKFDTGLLTLEILTEVGHFAQKLCGTKNCLINEIIEHNFAIDTQTQDPLGLFHKATRKIDAVLAESVFAVSSVYPRPQKPVCKRARKPAARQTKRKESVRNKAPPLRTVTSDNYFPICSAIGLELDVTPNLRARKILDLGLLTKAVVLEINEFASSKTGSYFPRTVCDILDYNFDLSSQHHRLWEFATATASKVQTLAKGRVGKRDRHEIFELPFLCYPKVTQRFQAKEQSSQTLNSNTIQDEGVKREEMESQSNYTCPLGEFDLDSDEDPDFGNTGSQEHLLNSRGSQSSDIPKESGSSCPGTCESSATSPEVALPSPAANSNVNTSYHQLDDKQGLCGNEERTETPGISPNGCDEEQEETGTEKGFWKMRSNRVEQIISPLNKEVARFTGSRKIGLEYNVGYGQRQNISLDQFTRSVLQNIAKFALAINSSQQDFITEILEHNFDLGLWSQHHRLIFKRQIMNRVRELRRCEDAVKFSSEVFELHGATPFTDKTSQSKKVAPEPLSAPEMVTDPPGSHGEIKEDYPFCKEIGLKLHTHSGRPVKKLDVSKLTNGVMTEVANFAEKLCGTFEQICLDVIRFNVDLDSESADSDLAGDIVAQIGLTNPVNVKSIRSKDVTRTISPPEELDRQDNTVLDASGPDCSQTPVAEQNAATSFEIKHNNELDLKLWRVRAKRIEQILTMPHEEHCPLYAFSRCKKLGIDFDVGSGVKQNLDPRLLTDGIVVELNALSKEMSLWRYFVMDILEYNFDLHLNGELHRVAFAQKVAEGINKLLHLKARQINMPFILPDPSSLLEPAPQCPKCYQDRCLNLHRDVLDPGHVHQPHVLTVTDRVSAEADSEAEKSATEEKIMKDFPQCKRIGLTLCMDKDKPKDKLDTRLLTNAIIKEVFRFAKRLCGIRTRVIQALVEHNFNIGREIHFAEFTRKMIALKKKGANSLDDVFVIPKASRRVKAAQNTASGRSEVLESIKNRKRVLQEKAKLSLGLGQKAQKAQKARKARKARPAPAKRLCPSPNINHYSLCGEIGLDLVTMFPADHWTMNMKMEENLLGADFGSSLVGSVQVKEEEYNPLGGTFKEEAHDEEISPHTESQSHATDTLDVRSARGEPAGSLKYPRVTLYPVPASVLKALRENEGFLHYSVSKPDECEERSE